MSDNKIDLCGCGKPVRYEDLETQEGSCNKYKRCPSYEELLIEVNKLRKCKSTLEKIKVVNAMDYEYRTWASDTLKDLYFHL